MARAATAAEMRQRAISRAIALGLAGEVVRVKCGWYRLPSTTRPGQWWTVRVVGGRWSCDCEAGRSGRPCVHQAAVLIRKLESGGARVTGPAPHAGEAAPAAVIDIRSRRAA